MSARNYPALLVAAACFCVALGGCKRGWYREQADEEARGLISEKTYSRWSTPYRGVEMDPRSRFHDPYDPVRPPMPPDDPESNRFMQQVAGKKQWSGWGDNGHVAELENPSWKDCLPSYVRLTSDGKVLLNLPEAVRLALIHSPPYQQQLETIYLSALDVSTERFRFETQFFGRSAAGSTGSPLFNQSSLGVTNSGQQHNTDASVRTDLALRNRLATAGEFIIGFANSFVWQFSGRDSNFAMSTLNFSLVQPLLRGAGRKIALEQLTIAERTLLANLRAFEAYRQGFYTLVAIGENNASGPVRRGGFAGSSGLSGFTGQGSGGFSAVGDATGFGRNAGNTGGGGGGAAGGGGFAGGGAGQVGGFIGLLQVSQQIRNTETSLRQQLQTLDLLEAHREAGLIDIAQVDQFRQSIETERANLLQSRNSLQTLLDTFKTTALGLPPDLPIELDDSYIHPFRLLDPQLQSLQVTLQDIVADVGNLSDTATVADVKATLARLLTLKTNVGDQFAPVAADVARMNDVQATRFQRMEPVERKLFAEDQKQLLQNLSGLQERFAATGEKLKKLDDEITEQNKDATTREIVSINVEMTNLISELLLVQARARVECITVEAVDLTPEVALEVARGNRFDWMNNRAQLVDTWRLIEFNANKLEANVDVFFSGNLGTVGDNAAKFGTDNSSLSAGVRFDAPFNRLVERNDFRQQLLVYQQSRRNLILFEDTVHRGLRSLLRDLEGLRVNLEIQRRAVAIAIRRVDQTRENLNKPTAPAQPGQPVAQFGPTAATNLLTALSDLRNSQNNFMSVWLNYQAGRMRLVRELGVMQVGDDGTWLELPIDQATRATTADEPLPPSVPQKWFDALDKLDSQDAGNTAPQNLPPAGPPIVPPADGDSIKPPTLPQKRDDKPEPNKLPAEGQAASAMPRSSLAPQSVLPPDTVLPPDSEIRPTPIAPASGWRATKK